MDLLPLLRTMGVEATLKSYGDALPDTLRDLGFMPREHVEFLLRLEPHYRAGCYVFVHAGVNPEADADQASPGGESLTVRDLFLSCPADGSETVVFGHTGFDTPFVAPGKIGVDTGAWEGNLLTAVEIPALVFHHA
jgi:serine/threonine protein phosphatase 1